MSFISRIAEALENLFKIGVRIADAFENLCRSVIQALPPEALSYDDAAKFIGVDVATVSYLIDERKLPYVQYGSQRGRMILVKDLRNFLTKCRQPGGEELLRRRHQA